jgi:hypothetical protein
MYWDKCYEILHNHDWSAAHEQQTAAAYTPDVALYCSHVQSIHNLVDLATQALRQDVEDGKIISMPLIPSNESVATSFVQMMAWQIRMPRPLVIMASSAKVQ